MSGFADVYQRLCERHPDERVRGLAFEPIVKRVLTTDLRSYFKPVPKYHQKCGRAKEPGSPQWYHPAFLGFGLKGRCLRRRNHTFRPVCH